MRAWGFDYAALRQVKPDMIMLGTCLMGQSGPLAQFAGFGNLAAAISGFFSLTSALEKLTEISHGIALQFLRDA